MPQTSPKNEENLSTRLYAIADYNFAQIVREIKQETNWLNPLVCKTFGKIFISKSIYRYIFSFYAFLLVSINMLDIMLQQPANLFFGLLFFRKECRIQGRLA